MQLSVPLWGSRALNVLKHKNSLKVSLAAVSSVYRRGYHTKWGIIIVVVVFVVHRSDHKKTKVKKKTSDPHFGETFSFEV